MSQLLTPSSTSMMSSTTRTSVSVPAADLDSPSPTDRDSAELVKAETFKDVMVDTVNGEQPREARLKSSLSGRVLFLTEQCLRIY